MQKWKLYFDDETELINRVKNLKNQPNDVLKRASFGGCYFINDISKLLKEEKELTKKQLTQLKKLSEEIIRFEFLYK